MIFACRQLFPRKGIRFLVEAAAQLKPRFPELKVVLAGDGFERPTLVRLAEELGIAGDVTFLGWVPNVDPAAVLPRRRAVGHSVAGGGLRHPGGGGDGLRGAGGRQRRRRAARRWWSTASPASSCPAATRPRWPRRSARCSRTRSGGGRWALAGRERALRLFDWDRTAEQFEQTLPRARRQGEPVSERLFAFRWDVDHRVCVTDGLPRIRAVCRDFGVPNTFFVNMGRSTNLREWLGKGMARSKAKLADRDAVHLIKKTGWPRFLLETALARPVGLTFVPVLQALQARRARARAARRHGSRRLEPPLPRAARRRAGSRRATSPTATSCGTSGTRPASPRRASIPTSG